jgi:signal transduction histidine kinase
MSEKTLFPFATNIQDILQFLPDKGQIRLADERILLFSQTAVSLLRKLMSAQLGPDLSRMLIAQFGYQHGVKDFETIGPMFSWQSDAEKLAAGPLMHAWSGLVEVEPLKMEMDRETGHFYFRGLWHHSYEAEIYLRNHGLSHEPVCYSLAGYGSGWCSAFFGKPLLEIERRCIATGATACEWEIRPWDEWGEEAEPWKKSLLSTSHSIYQELLLSNEKISQLNLDLEKEVERRTEENRKLLRMICHDIVVPLQAMKRALPALKLNPNELELNATHGTLFKCLDAIQELLAQVREAEACALGKIPSAPQVVDVNDALSTIVLMFGGLLEKKNIRLNIENTLGQTDMLWVPPVIFTSNILSNILSNAIKFSPRDAQILIRVSRQNDRIKIIVRDEGMGIPTRLRSQVFSSKIPTSRLGTDGEKGTGFGLPIVKSYVETIGGQIEIDSRTMDEDTLNHGTTVTVMLPSATMK